MKSKKIRLPDLVGKGYKDFWNFKGRYRVCKGSRGSKKSKTTALFFYLFNDEISWGKLACGKKSLSDVKGQLLYRLEMGYKYIRGTGLLVS